MRRLVDVLVILTVVVLAGGAAWQWQQRAEFRLQIEQTRQSVQAIRTQVDLHSALERGQLSRGGHPMTIDPGWFTNGLPRNPLVGDGHPWLEIAPRSQRHLRHPPHRLALDDRDAQFWYNPYTGDVRARVPAGVSDAEALRWYNQVNNTSLQSLFE